MSLNGENYFTHIITKHCVAFASPYVSHSYNQTAIMISDESFDYLKYRQSLFQFSENL